MKAVIRGKNIILNGSGVSPLDPGFAQIPSARYYKRKDYFSYSASPIVASRIMSISSNTGIRLDCSKEFQDLLNVYDLIQKKKKYKCSAFKKLADIATTTGPNVFKTSTLPWAHQYSASLFIKDLPSAYLAMDMGTGKTLVIINELLETVPQWTLIVCPKAVIDVWEDEFKIHAPGHPFNVVLLNQKSSAKKAEQLDTQIHLSKARKQPMICVVNYESMYRGTLGKLILSGRWDYVVLDEAHKIKSAGGKASKFAAKITSKIRRCLSGTPFPNNKLDAFGQYRFLDQGFFGTSFGRHRNRFAEMGGYGGYEILGWRNEQEFNRLIDMIMFRVDQSVLNLPADTTFWRVVTLSLKGKELLRKLGREFIVWMDSGEAVTAANALTRLIRMRQITSGFAKDEFGDIHPIDSGREDALKEVLEEIGVNDGPVVVAAEFTYDLDRISAVCAKMGRAYGEVRGGVNDLVAAKIPPGLQVVGVQPQSGSLGLNMTAAHYLVFYSVGYRLSDHLQMKKRVLRGGQTLETRFIHLVAPQTIDVEVYKALKKKKDVIDHVMDYVKNGGKI